MSCSRHVASNGLMLRSPLTAFLNAFPDHRTDISIARYNKPQPFTIADIRRNSLSMASDRQNAFDDTVNYNVLDIDSTVESPNQLLDNSAGNLSHR